MTYLLDGNVLVALPLDGHVHHTLVNEWYAADPKRKFATCAVTQATLLRMHMTFAPDTSAAAAWAMLDALCRHPQHEFWQEGFGYLDVPHHNLQGPKQVTNAWLAELARQRRSRLVTLDKGLIALHKDVALAIT